MDSAKRVEGIDPAMSPAEAARRLLDQRLEAVWHFLPLAAQRAEEDVEYVHQLRVATRRARAALRLFGPLLPPRRSERLMKALRRTRKAAGAARDLDVMLARHVRDVTEVTDGAPRDARLLQSLRDRRSKAQKPIVREYERLAKKDRFTRRVDALLCRVRARSDEDARARFDAWGRTRLREILADFLAARPDDPSDLDALHRFRIRSKRLRYAMELLAPALPAEFREEFHPWVVQLQEHLGEINDHAVALARLERWADERARGDEAGHDRDLLRREQEALDRALEGFRQWWDDAREKRSLERLDDMLDEA